MEGRSPTLFTSTKNDSLAAAGAKFLIKDFDKRVDAALAIQVLDMQAMKLQNASSQHSIRIFLL
jgi:hypothetical protein